jgi:transposase
MGSKRLSNNKSKGENNRKNGNKYLAWAYVEIANCAKRYCPQARAFYLKKSMKTNKTLAIKALAHKLARACYYIMKDNVAFDVTKIFGKPILKNGCGREPELGLATKPISPIGMPAAADL